MELGLFKTQFLRAPTTKKVNKNAKISKLSGQKSPKKKVLKKLKASLDVEKTYGLLLKMQLTKQCYMHTETEETKSVLSVHCG